MIIWNPSDAQPVKYPTYSGVRSSGIVRGELGWFFDCSHCQQRAFLPYEAVDYDAWLDEFDTHQCAEHQEGTARD